MTMSDSGKQTGESGCWQKQWVMLYRESLCSKPGSYYIIDFLLNFGEIFIFRHLDFKMYRYFIVENANFTHIFNVEHKLLKKL